MPGEEVQAESGGTRRSTTGPRHAAPRKSFLARLQMPAGKAIALAAMPSAVLMGMGLTPRLAQADEIPKNGFAPGKCVSAPDKPVEEESTGTEKDQDEGAKDTGATETATADKDATSPTGSGDAQDDAQAPESQANPKPDAPNDPKPDPESEPGGDEGDGQEPGADEPGTPEDTTPPSDEDEDAGDGESGGILDPILDPITDLLGLDGDADDEDDATGEDGDGDSAGDEAANGSDEADTPTAGDPAKEKPAEKPQASDDKPDASDGKPATDPEGTDDTAADAGTDASSPKPGEDTKDDPATDDPAKDGAKDADEQSDAAQNPDGKEPFPCPEEKKVAGDNEQTPNVLPDKPWVLKSSRLALHGLDYKGVVNVRTANGTTKQALKFTASGVDIGDLHQLVEAGGGLTYHVAGRDGSTSTIRRGTVTMYTESLKGNLLGIIPITFDPEHPPPINLPEIFFTDVTVTQAGQFGGELTIPGMRVYTTGH